MIEPLTVDELKKHEYIQINHNVNEYTWITIYDLNTTYYWDICNEEPPDKMERESKDYYEDIIYDATFKSIFSENSYKFITKDEFDNIIAENVNNIS